MTKAYALAHLYNPSAHPEVLEYLERIQGTLEPFEGRFLVHGPQVEVREGEWPGTLVIIEFPSTDLARRWYESPAYQEILHLRANHLVGDLILVDGVGPDHDSAELAERLRRSGG
jgi:uncharacterized protein (DUF1330 family)